MTAEATGPSLTLVTVMATALLVVNVWAAMVAAFNLRFGTNYMFLCHKPQAASALDMMGPWPWYLIAGEVVAFAIFFLLGLPFRRSLFTEVNRR